MPTDEMTPATRADLRDAIAPLATKAELKEAIAPLATKAELLALEERLYARLASIAEALAEHVSKLFGVLDDKFQGIHGQVAALRAEHDLHVRDASVHRAPRRTKRAKPRG